jgi:hypothetical protein
MARRSCWMTERESDLVDGRVFLMVELVTGHGPCRWSWRAHELGGAVMQGLAPSRSDARAMARRVAARLIRWRRVGVAPA